MEFKAWGALLSWILPIFFFKRIEVLSKVNLSDLLQGSNLKELQELASSSPHTHLVNPTQTLPLPVDMHCWSALAWKVQHNLAEYPNPSQNHSCHQA